MAAIELPEGVAVFIDATNRGDSDAFVEAFTDDAVLTDWGRVFRGRNGVRDWNRTDNIGVNAHFDLVGVAAGADDSYVVTLTVSGGGYNGTGPMVFVLRDGRIASLTIAATS